jgi:hypothetical protein
VVKTEARISFPPLLTVGHVFDAFGLLRTVKTNECCVAASSKVAAQLAPKQVLVTRAAMRPTSDIWLGAWR